MTILPLNNFQINFEIKLVKFLLALSVPGNFNVKFMNLQRNILIKTVGRGFLLFFFDEVRYGVHF